MGGSLGRPARLGFSRAWQTGLQFDSMFTLGQELPLGARYNAFVRFAWKG